MFKEHDKVSDDVDSCVFFGFPCDSRTRDIFRPHIASGEFQTNYRFEDWSTTTFGIQYNRRSASTTGGIDEAIGNVGYYLQQQFQFLDRSLIMIPGIRLDDNQQFGTAWTPSFSAAYLFKEIGTKLKGGYAKGFRAPTLNELFFPAGFGCPAFGNPNLGPEKSWEINFGVEQNFLAERIKIGGNYFHREVRDLIEGRPIPGDPFGCFRAENVGSARFDGVELTLGIKLFEGLTLNANYTYLDWDTADGTLPRRPHNSGNVILNYLQDALNVNLIVNIVGRRDDFQSRLTVRRYGHCGIWDCGPRIILQASVAHAPCQGTEPDRQNPEPVQQEVRSGGRVPRPAAKLFARLSSQLWESIGQNRFKARPERMRRI